MQIIVAFVPFIVYWGLTAVKLPELAATAGLVVSAGSMLLRWRAREVKTLGVVTLAFFAVDFYLTVVVHSSFFTTYGLLSTSATLALVSWGTLWTGSPFTLQYAQDRLPLERSNDPRFLRALGRVNEILTAAWGTVFLVNTVLGALSLWQSEAPFFPLLPYIGIALGIVFTAVFPNWYFRQTVTAEVTGRDS